MGEVDQFGGGLKLDEVFLGEHHTEEMLKLPSEKGRRFRKVKGSDVYEVVESGILQLYDREGRLMVEADPLK